MTRNSGNPVTTILVEKVVFAGFCNSSAIDPAAPKDAPAAVQYLFTSDLMKEFIIQNLQNCKETRCNVPGFFLPFDKKSDCRTVSFFSSVTLLPCQTCSISV